MPLPQPLLLRVEFAFELEKANHIIGQIVRSLHRKMWNAVTASDLSRSLS